MQKTLIALFSFLMISACNNPQPTSSKFSAPGPGKYIEWFGDNEICLLYTSPSPRDVEESRMPSSA